MENSEYILTDREVMGAKAEISHEEVVHMAELTAEEKLVEKRLVRQVDRRIMPLVILVYLMNYIDR